MCSSIIFDLTKTCFPSSNLKIQRYEVFSFVSCKQSRNYFGSFIIYYKMEFKTHYNIYRLVRLNKAKEQELSLQTHHFVFHVETTSSQRRIHVIYL